MTHKFRNIILFICKGASETMWNSKSGYHPYNSRVDNTFTTLIRLDNTWEGEEFTYYMFEEFYNCRKDI